MIKFWGILSLVLLFGITSCKNIVRKFDQQVHKSYQRNNFVSQSVELGEHQVFYYDNKRENVPVMLFLQGFGGDGKISWQKQALAFEEDYRVIIPDILWFGNSTSKAHPELTSQIDAINQLIEFLKIDQIHLVGISYGGFISLGVEQENETKLASLIIVDSPGVHFSDDELKIFTDKIGVEKISDAFVPQNSDEVKRMLSFASLKPHIFTKDIREQILGFYLSKNPEEQIEMISNLPKNRVQFEDLKIDKPVLILWGEDDEVFLIDDAKQLQEQLNAELVIIPKAGHSLPVEQPKDFNRALRSFIEKVE
ncbi:alpha/beta fold hydrolase [Brumimicrobium mesophilum]|uniref:alpha/beta fold hydrolase n=1 Tax=Brumimicrobium mesophilum TaxID=392717 RepID=UPI000D14026B|nr:alpha/beta hydrolase [Brumimicrobium mesophilum]